MHDGRATLRRQYSNKVKSVRRRRRYRVDYHLVEKPGAKKNGMGKVKQDSGANWHTSQGKY